MFPSHPNPYDFVELCLLLTAWVCFFRLIANPATETMSRRERVRISWPISVSWVAYFVILGIDQPSLVTRAFCVFFDVSFLTFVAYAYFGPGSTQRTAA